MLPFRFKRGPLSRLPVLSEGEPAMTNDTGTERLYFGSSSGNIRVLNYNELTGILGQNLLDIQDITPVDTDIMYYSGDNGAWVGYSQANFLGAHLYAIRGLFPADDDFLQLKEGSWANRTIAEVRADLVDGYSQPIDQDLTDIAALSPSNDDVLQRKSGAWTNRTLAQLKTDLALPIGVLEFLEDNASLVTANGTYYKPVGNGAWSINNNRPFRIPFDCVVKNFYFDAISGWTGSEQGVVTVMKNGVDTGITLTITANMITGSDLVNSATFAAGDSIVLKCVQTGNGAGSLNSPRFSLGMYQP